MVTTSPDSVSALAGPGPGMAPSAADVGLEFVSSVIGARDPGALSLIEEGDLSEVAVPVYKFVAEYIRRYHQVPAFEIVTRWAGVMLPPAPGTVEHHADRVLNFAMIQATGGEVRGVAELLKAGKGREAIDAFTAASRRLVSDYSGAHGEDESSLAESIDELLTEYENASTSENEVTGVPTPWQPLNHLTLGWQPGEFYTFLGRPHMGKTWMTCVMVDAARRAGIPVLYLSLEMSRMRIHRRLAAIAAGCPYPGVRRGTLTPKQLTRYREALEYLRRPEASDVVVVGRRSVRSLSTVETKIAENAPGLVIVDGFYNLRIDDTKGMKENERVAEQCWALKEASEGFEVPLIGVSQFNRSVGDEDTRASLRQTGFSDAMARDPDGSFAIFMPPALKAVNECEIFCLKWREEDMAGTSLRVGFDTRAMDFGFRGYVDHEGRLTKDAPGQVALAF